jgi:hypothetical protein
VFREKLGLSLNPDDLEASALLLDEHLRTERLKRAFSRPDFHWYFVKPVGAFTGELLRRHAGGDWQAQAGRAPCLLRTAGSLTVKAFPFEKVLRHVAKHGQKGDFCACLKADAVIPRLEANPAGPPGE